MTYELLVLLFPLLLLFPGLPVTAEATDWPPVVVAETILTRNKDSIQTVTLDGLNRTECATAAQETPEIGLYCTLDQSSTCTLYSLVIPVGHDDSSFGPAVNCFTEPSYRPVFTPDPIYTTEPTPPPPDSGGGDNIGSDSPCGLSCCEDFEVCVIDQGVPLCQLRNPCEYPGCGPYQRCHFDGASFTCQGITPFVFYRYSPVLVWGNTIVSISQRITE